MGQNNGTILECGSCGVKSSPISNSDIREKAAAHRERGGRCTKCFSTNAEVKVVSRPKVNTVPRRDITGLVCTHKDWVEQDGKKVQVRCQTIITGTREELASQSTCVEHTTNAEPKTRSISKVRKVEA